MRRPRISRRRSGVALAIAVAVAFGTSAPDAQELRALEPLDRSGRITYFIADALPGSQYRPGDDDLAEWALKRWEASTGGAIKFEPSDEDDALVRVYWVPASAGQYGEMRPLLVKGRRGAAVFIRPDTNALGDEIARLARADTLLRDAIVHLTCLHELGHALGLSHTANFADIMYFFGYGGDIPRFFGRYRDALRTRDDISRQSGLSAEDVRRIRALYTRQ